jgi:hypothetical protein
MKALTREVNRARKWPQRVSQDSVTRALDFLYEQIRDRRFERVRRERRPHNRKAAGDRLNHERSGRSSGSGSNPTPLATSVTGTPRSTGTGMPVREVDEGCKLAK